MPKRAKIVNQGDRAEIYIYDDIGEGWFGGISAHQFAQDLDELTARDIDVRINSAGGSVFEGVSIYNSLKRKDANISVYVDGVAASIASVIAMAGDTVTIGDGAMMMIHRANTYTYGDAEEHVKAANLLEAVEAQIKGIYQKRVNLDSDELQEMLDAETWLTGEEAVEHGFADSVGESMDVAACIRPGIYDKAPQKWMIRNETEPAKEPETHWRRLAAQRKIRLTG